MSPEELQKMVEDKVKAQLPNVARALNERIQQQYETVVDMFYNDYDPSQYGRDYNTYMASTGAYDIMSETTITDKGIEGGIRVDSSLMSPHYHDPASYVFPRTFAEGIHGTRGVGVMATPPEVMMSRWFESFKTSEIPKIMRKNITLK